MRLELCAPFYRTAAVTPGGTVTWLRSPRERVAELGSEPVAVGLFAWLPPSPDTHSSPQTGLCGFGEQARPLFKCLFVALPCFVGFLCLDGIFRNLNQLLPGTILFPICLICPRRTWIILVVVIAQAWEAWWSLRNNREVIYSVTIVFCSSPTE